MPIDVTYTQARANLAKLWDQAISEREPIVIRRRGKESVALIPVDELSGLIETAHLLRSPQNAKRLLAALVSAREKPGEPQSLADLKTALGFDDG